MELQVIRWSSLLIVGALLFCSRVRTHENDYYTAAVYEHRRIDEGPNLSYTDAVTANLDYYRRAASMAKQQGADLILYPEYGIPVANGNRSEIRKYTEVVPDPKEITVNPCDEAEVFADRPILQTLSCMAKANDIVVVANMLSLAPCEGESDCPEDGALLFNTNVAFGENGTLLARYYKEHLYFELGLNVPREVQDPIFETKFGKFSMFICFDIIFEKMAHTSRLQDVDAVLFSTMWFNSLPFYTSVPWFQAWAIGNNATLLASNLQLPGWGFAGSGIFRGSKGSVVHSLNPDGISKLMVATLPKRNQDISSRIQLTAILENGTEGVRKDGTDVPEICSHSILGDATDIYNDYRCINEDVSNFTLVKLKETEGHVEVCSNKMCCELHYVASNMSESYYLGVFNGTHNNSEIFRHPKRYSWAGENCFLARCDDVNGTACSHFPTTSETFFYNITMTANFTTKYVYPSMVSSRLRLVPVDGWAFSSEYDRSTIRMNSSSGIQVLSATMLGRAYERDPPYAQ